MGNWCLSHTAQKEESKEHTSFQSSRQQTGGGECRGSVLPPSSPTRCCVHVNDCHKNVLPARKLSITASSQLQSSDISSMSAHSVPHRCFCEKAHELNSWDSEREECIWEGRDPHPLVAGPGQTACWLGFLFPFPFDYDKLFLFSTSQLPSMKKKPHAELSYTFCHIISSLKVIEVKRRTSIFQLSIPAIWFCRSKPPTKSLFVINLSV